MSLIEFLQQLINGVSLGSVYALIALGYTMVYGIIGLINFAHCDIYMVGAYIGFFVATYARLPFIPALLIAMLGSALLGVVIERVAYKPLRRTTNINLLITAIGVSLLLENGFNAMFGGNPRTYPGDILKQQTVMFGPIRSDALHLIILGISLLLLVLLNLFVNHTKMGRAMRATSLDKDAAALMGINVNTTISMTFAIGSALAGAAGMLVAILYSSLDPYMGMMPGIKSFVAAVLGGIGLIPGAFVGGIILGVVETFMAAINSKIAGAVAFVILIVILIIKPTGLLGKAVKEKV
ncbi:High-affinity branched-chain amino acid transport system permease protein LivH [Caprobacter fermentans]|uniref:High-affinity branched-chain amino acid transport system permease protein LivH n=1 Tax=Caproicibacter fermentans TaxID=2576756 RepID=A0A6N8HY41_9FIRM|nr:High-affinity branched-chain amino acid transport system permease protein LivH [Caproicibacter fermentans]